MLTEVVMLTATCWPGFVTTWTTLPAGIDVFRLHCRPVVRFCIVGVPGPVIVHTGQA